MLVKLTFKLHLMQLNCTLKVYHDKIFWIPRPKRVNFVLSKGRTILTFRVFN